jgi:glycyl-tRNA synthetase
MLDKVRRIERLTAYIVQALDLTEAERVSAQQAAELCKADLATSMVVEMTSLQGEMGRTYALRSGESEAVAQALFEHHLPRFAGDALPGSRVGLAVGLADRLDTLLGLFGVGLQPTGARDPFGLRRAAIGLIQCLVGFQQRFDLRSALEQARPLFHPLTIPPEALDGCLEFLAGRQEALLLSDGKPHDVVQAVLAFQGNDPAGARLAVEALEAAVREPEWPTTLQAFARCARILRSVAPLSKGARRLSEPAEKALDEDLRKAESATRRRGSVADFLAVFRPLIPAITTFFEDVLVMSEQPAEREARLSLLGRVIALAEGVADLSRLEGF